ncbi:hypothetical protein Axy21_047 [Achromobacter phage vB_AxyP_19-32_Axy21]|uniref:Uncharacterized protein n=1 Tax=Achromobacter phage vB_AxyP_19-32_Axy21 TaxID=2591045 RepID=A0A514CVT9_9CAUD|nr:hypothetical protein Axy21_047 [Achromobacter phage vB_AxyP_19-32_Axy21]
MSPVAPSRSLVVFVLGLCVAVVLAVAALLWQQHSITTLKIENRALAAQLKADRVSYPAVQKAAQAARTRAAEAKEKLNDPTLSDWRAAPLPDGVRDALKRSP